MKVNRADFLELSREILGRGVLLRFQAPGDSMRPFIDHGDILVVEPLNGNQTHIGDVIFYRRPNGRLFAHRLIKIDTIESRTVLTTKGDSLDYFDPPLRPEQVLGRVIAIERDGRYLKLDSGLNKVMSSSWARLSSSSRWLRPILRPGWRLYRMASPAGLQGLFELYLSKVQGISVYRRVASSLRTGIEIREADEEDMRLVHDWLNPGQVENTISENLHETCFVAKRGSRVTGCVYLVRRPEQAYPHDGYWLINLMVRTLYRGMGIGEELSRMVMEKSRKERAKGLSLLVNEYNHRAIRLYRKLGFEMRVIPALERELEHERCTLGYRRVLMFACLGGEDERRPFGVVLPQSQPNADKADTKSGQTLLACERKTDNVSLAISIVNLTKRFPRTSGYRDLLPFRQKQWVTAVDNVSLDINEGEFFGLLGPNGAGKTTLIKVLCSLVIPNSGTAQIFGHDILSEEQAVKKLVGLVSAEERSFFWRLTGRDNLQFYASLYNLTQQQAKKRIDELLNLVGLVDESDIRFQNYSTGMRQKLAIARGLLSYPRVLFVDEPTKSLDPVSAKAVRRFLKEKVAAEGKTVVLATHNLTEAEQLCDRLAIMDHGRVIALGSIQELRSLFKKHEGCELQVRHFSDTILPQLRLINGVLDCRLTSQHDGVSSLELRISDRWTVLPQILQIMVHSGAGVCDCQLRELPLEEIFVNILSGSATKESN